jgi:NADH-quinone oxidoreductase subunit G
MPRPKHAEPKLVNIEINGISLQVPEGEYLVEAAKQINADIPIFCYHKYMEAVGMCRMCLVEVGSKQADGSVRKMPKPQAACTLPCTEGLVAWTETEQIINDRRAVLEFLLINHPLDCPICDRGGECPLQNNTQFYGPSTSRYIEIKRHLPKSFPLSKHVVLDLERCIQCGRCVRFTDEVSGDGQLAFLFRGAYMQPHTFQLTEFTSRFSGNVIEICPVGALTNRNYRFRARPWDIVTQKTVCSMCSNGCNLYLDSRGGQMVRINARENPHVNETWTCDKGKFGQDYIRSPKRLTKPMIRKNGVLEPAEWHEAYDLILSKFAEARATDGPNAIAGFGGQRCSNEDLYMFQKLFRVGFRSNNLDHRLTRYQGNLSKDVFTRLGIYTTQNEMADLEATSLVFVFGSNLIDEQPMVYLRTRKAWHRYGVKALVAYPVSTEAEHFAEAVLHYRPGTELELSMGLIHHLTSDVGGLGDNLPLEGLDELKRSVAACTPEWVERQTGVAPEALRRAADLIASSPRMVLLCGEKVWNHPRAQSLIQALVNLTILTGNAEVEEGGFNLMLSDVNSQGALDMGVLPDRLPGYVPLGECERLTQLWNTELPSEPGLTTDEMFHACIDGSVKCLYVLGSDPVAKHYDPTLAARAVRSAGFVVVQDVLMTGTAEYADVVLPACTFAEREGTYTNFERRVQRFWKALPPTGEAKPDWLVFSELLLRHTKRVPPFNPRDAMKEIAQAVRAYASCTYEELKDQGVRWGYEPVSRRNALLPLELGVEV